MATTYRQRPATGQMIYDHLKNHGDTDKWTIIHATGLTHTQFWYGLGFLKDVLQTANGRPLVWSPRRGVYSLTTDEGEWMEYLLNWRLRSILTQLRRTEQTAIAGGMFFGKRKQAIRVAIAGISSARAMVEALAP
jgi:hypothetical protein